LCVKVVRPARSAAFFALRKSSNAALAAGLMRLRPPDLRLRDRFGERRAECRGDLEREREREPDRDRERERARPYVGSISKSIWV